MIISSLNAQLLRFEMLRDREKSVQKIIGRVNEIKKLARSFDVATKQFLNSMKVWIDEQNPTTWPQTDEAVLAKLDEKTESKEYNFGGFE